VTYLFSTKFAYIITPAYLGEETRRGDGSQLNFEKPEHYLNNMPTSVPDCGFPIRLSLIFLGHFWSLCHTKAPNRSFLLAAEVKE